MQRLRLKLRIGSLDGAIPFTWINEHDRLRVAGVRMADVFLSYKREERAAVERLANALRGLGLEVWFDAGLSAGEAFSDEINREVRAARAVLTCWSPGAAGSQWVKAEAQIGFGKKNLISIYIAGPDGFEPPVPYNNLHMEDMRAWTERPSARDPAWLSVLRRLGALLGRADVAEWGALGADASIAQIEAWLETHGSTSSLVTDAESFLREREAAEQSRASEMTAARERLERVKAEKEAAEAIARQERERAAAEENARRLEAKLAEAKRRANATRRGLLFAGGGIVGAGALAVGGYAWMRTQPPWIERAWVNARTDGSRAALSAFLREYPNAPQAPEARTLLRGIPLATFQHEGSVRNCAFSRDGARVLTLTFEKLARVWDVASGRAATVVQGGGGSLSDARFSPDSERIVTAPCDKRNYDDPRNSHVEEASDYIARVWDAASGREMLALSGHTGDVQTAAFNPAGDSIVTASSDRTARVWDASRGAQLLALQGHENLLTTASFSSSGRRIVTASFDDTARVWDAATGAQVAVLRGHGHGGLAADAGVDAFTGVPRGIPREHLGNVMEAAFSPDDTRIVTRANDGTARVWDAEDGREIARMLHEYEVVSSVEFSPDGRRIVSCSSGPARVWDAQSGAQLLALQAPSPKTAHYSPDGARILTAAWDGTVAICDSITGESIEMLSGHTDAVWSAEFSPDGQRVATASSDQTVRVWDVGTR